MPFCEYKGSRLSATVPGVWLVSTVARIAELLANLTATFVVRRFQSCTIMLLVQSIYQLIGTCVLFGKRDVEKSAAVLWLGTTPDTGLERIQGLKKIRQVSDNEI